MNKGFLRKKTLTIGSKKALPIVQGGMAIKISLSSLAAAVAEEKGVGIIGGSGLTSEELRREIKRAKYLSKGVIGVNLMVALSNFKELVRVALEEKVDALFVGAGFSRDVFQRGKEAGVAIIPIVSSLKAAVMAEKIGAAAVVVEGKEAGGHLGTDKSLFSILRPIVKKLKIPVIAAGGILNFSEIKKAFSLGASGVQLGTRFAATEEASVAPSWKEFYIRAKPEDVTLIKSPAGLPGRVIRNSLVKRILKGKEVKPKLIKNCRSCLRNCLKNFCILDALFLAQQGDVENGLIFSGERAGEIKNILSVKEVFKALQGEVVPAAT